MLEFNENKYAKLLADTLPRVVTDSEEYDRLETVANKLLNKGENKISPEEDQLLGLLTNLLEEYEARTLPPLEDIPPAGALRFLMDENDLKQADLEDVFGSQSAVSRALNGSRRISIDQAKGLARKFKVSAELFI
jgi:HTH-type transcriptional regulator / antitoxin HigA